jgi:hypothetical protein
MKYSQNKSGFKVPDGYFDTFTGKLLETLREQEAHLPKYDGFSVPDGYFESLDERLRDKISLPADRVIPLQAYKKYFLAAAAVAAIVMLFVLMPERNTPQPGFEDLARADIANYMENNELEFTEDEITQSFPVEELEIGDMLESRLNDEYIMEYLDNSMEDYEELNFEINE